MNINKWKKQEAKDVRYCHKRESDVSIFIDLLVALAITL